MQNIERFKLVSADLIEKFQHLEESLKACLVSNSKILEYELKKPVDTRKIEKITLGVSVERFAKICEDEDLISALRLVVPVRNNLAHKSLSLTIGESEDSGYLQDRIEKMNQIMAEVTLLHNCVLEIRYLLLRKERALARESSIKNY